MTEIERERMRETIIAKIHVAIDCAEYEGERSVAERIADEIITDCLEPMEANDERT